MQPERCLDSLRNYNLNFKQRVDIPGIFAMLKDVINYPHIDFQYIEEG